MWNHMAFGRTLIIPWPLAGFGIFKGLSCCRRPDGILWRCKPWRRRKYCCQFTGMLTTYDVSVGHPVFRVRTLLVQFLNLIFMDPCIVVWISRNTNKMQLCNRIHFSKVYWRLNMFRAAHRSSSGALNCICSLWFIYPCGDRPLSRLSGKLIRYLGC